MKDQNGTVAIIPLRGAEDPRATEGERERASLKRAPVDRAVVAKASAHPPAKSTLAAAIRSTQRHVGRGGLCSVCAYLQTLSRPDAKALSQALAVGGPPAMAIVAVLDEHDPEHRLTRDRINNHRYGHRARRDPAAR